MLTIGMLGCNPGVPNSNSRPQGSCADLTKDGSAACIKKDANEVDIVLDCTRGGGGNKKIHSFTYEAKPVAGDALLFRLSSVGPAIDGSFQMRPTKPKGNVLEFFTKADWLYSSKKALVYGITQLGKLDYRYDTTSLNGENDFNQALSYAKDPANGGGYNIAPTNPNSGNDVGAVSFVFSKI